MCMLKMLFHQGYASFISQTVAPWVSYQYSITISVAWNTTIILLPYRSSFSKIKKIMPDLPQYTFQNLIVEPFWKNLKFIKFLFNVFWFFILCSSVTLNKKRNLYDMIFYREKYFQWLWAFPKKMSQKKNRQNLRCFLAYFDIKRLFLRALFFIFVC